MVKLYKKVVFDTIVKDDIGEILEETDGGFKVVNGNEYSMVERVTSKELKKRLFFLAPNVRALTKALTYFDGADFKERSSAFTFPLGKVLMYRVSYTEKKLVPYFGFGEVRTSGNLTLKERYVVADFHDAGLHLTPSVVRFLKMPIDDIFDRLTNREPVPILSEFIIADEKDWIVSKIVNVDASFRDMRVNVEFEITHGSEEGVMCVKGITDRVETFNVGEDSVMAVVLKAIPEKVALEGKIPAYLLIGRKRGEDLGYDYVVVPLDKISDRVFKELVRIIVRAINTGNLLIPDNDGSIRPEVIFNRIPGVYEPVIASEFDNVRAFLNLAIMPNVSTKTTTEYFGYFRGRVRKLPETGIVFANDTTILVAKEFVPNGAPEPINGGRDGFGLIGGEYRGFGVSADDGGVFKFALRI